MGKKLSQLTKPHRKAWEYFSDNKPKDPPPSLKDLNNRWRKIAYDLNVLIKDYHGDPCIDFHIDCVKCKAYLAHQIIEDTASLADY